MKPRIILVTTSFPDGESGSEAAGAFVADFARELAQHASVSVLAPGRCSALSLEGTLLVKRFHAPRQPLSLLKPYNPLHWPAIIRTVLAGQAALDEMLASEAFDHILAFWVLPSGYWARKTPTQIPYSTWALGSDIWTLGRIPVVRSVLRKILRDCEVCFADGVALARDVSRISGKPCAFLPSSRKLDIEGASPPAIAAPPYKLAFLGRFHPNKGIDLLLDSLDLLETQDWSAISHIRIAGGGPLQETVAAGVKRLQEKGVPITLEGYKNQAEAQELLGWADFVLIPSRIESIPVIFSDAMQMGKPVIASPVGDLPALIGEYRVGVVAEHVAPASYARLLRPNILEQTAPLALNTPLATEKFSVEKIVQDFMRQISR